MIRDHKLTSIMLKSLKKDPSLEDYDSWMKGGDFATEMRFFPHAFNCYHNALELNKTQEAAEKLNTILDKITNVLEVLPEELKEDVEEFRLSNPLDPSKWLALANKLLKKETEFAEEIDYKKYFAARIALSMCSYCILRSGGDAAAVNQVLSQICENVDAKNFNSPVTEFDSKTKKDDEPIRVVAYGDQVTLGLYPNWELRFEETYHFLWSKASDKFITLANTGISGASAMDALLYLKRDVLNYQPDITLLNFGLNDAWLGSQALLAYENILHSVIELIKDKTKVVLISPLPHIPEACPIDERPSDIDLAEADIKSWTNALKRVAIKTGCSLADLAAVFPEEKSERRKYLANGFNQANLEGQKLIKEALDKVLRVN